MGSISCALVLKKSHQHSRSLPMPRMYAMLVFLDIDSGSLQPEAHPPFIGKGKGGCCGVCTGGTQERTISQFVQAEEDR